MTSTSSYCGGARPDPAILSDISVPQPLRDEKIFIRKGETNDLALPVVASGVSDSLGLVSLRLPPGKYCAVTTRKSDDAFYRELIRAHAHATSQWSAVDSICLKQWLAIPDLVFEVSPANLFTDTLNIQRPCFWKTVPCADYLGPLPR